eukprot:TRINITY_DN33572_c0_g1_i2.p1 TRINITY_DN33572_c0_g1~~TRINITY_DN33572_c0_g1_i2.p1  ORF type:complete len:380 (-),score=25.55 TRINITY_DN33572_c0_g1_i2:178-1260(-)
MGGSLGHTAHSICDPTGPASPQKRGEEAIVRPLSPPPRRLTPPVDAPATCGAATSKGKPDGTPDASSHGSGWLRASLQTVAAWLIIRLICLRCPLADAATLWAWLSFFLFLRLAQRGASEAEAVAPPSPAVATPGDKRASGSTWAESYRWVVQHLDETRPPTSASELKALGWKDASRPSARLFLQFLKSPAKCLASISVETQEQAPDIPLVDVKAGSVCGGFVPIFWAIQYWPSWFPFCKSAERVAYLSADRQVWHLRFQIAFISLDVVLCCNLVNNLETTGTIDFVMWSPPNSLAGKPWIDGIVLPKNAATLRVEMVSLRLSLRPTGRLQASVCSQFEMFDTVGIEWIYTLFWQTACME